MVQFPESAVHPPLPIVVYSRIPDPSLAPSTASAQETETVRAVLVTGTSSGIGLRITEVLSENGFFVYAGARKTEDLARLDALENAKAVRLNVTIQSEIDAAVERIRAEGRGLYGLVNNAGVAVLGPLIELSEEALTFSSMRISWGPTG